MKRLGIAAVLLLAACAAPSATAPSPLPASAAHSPAGEVLFAASTQDPCGPSCHVTVTIAGLDGRARAKATFEPPARPAIGCEGGFVVPHVQVAAGSVFYLDSSGAVHRLRASGENQVVAKFPVLTTQQLTSFAVSPDGTKLLVSITAFPPLVAPTSEGCPEHVPGDVVQELDAASVQGPTTTVYSVRSAFSGKLGPPHRTAVVGWDGLGPIAVTELQVAYIGFVQGTIWLGPVAHLDGQGKPGTQIGGPDCVAWFGALPDGRLVCYDAKHPTVRDRDGNILWALKPLDPNDNFTYGAIALSPDATRVAFSLDSSCCYVFDSSVVRSRDGVRIGLGSSFQPQGWLDGETVIGLTGTVKPVCSGCNPNFVPSSMAVVRLATPTKIEDLGFLGDFLGVVQGP